MVEALDRVADVSASQRAMVESDTWKLIDALLGGTPAMRANAAEYLPKEAAEDEFAYVARVKRSVLYEAFKDTVRRLRSKPFSKPVTLDGELPERLTSLQDDADGLGTDLTQFAAALFDDACARGLTHVFVDYPNTAASPDETEEQRKQRVSASAEKALRPTFMHVKAADVLSGKTARDENGRSRLVEVRFRECRYEPDGEYGEKKVEYVRVVTLTSWSLFRKKDGGGWESAGNGPLTLGVVPFVTIYFQRTGFMTAEPPLGALAWVSLQHFQSDSDQRSCLRFNRFGILWQCGVSDEEKEKPVAIGPAKLVRTTASKETADMKVVEGSGAGLEAGRKDIEGLEVRMEVLGVQPLMARSGDATATGQSLDASKTQCDVQAWVRAIERGLTQCFELGAKWTATTLEKAFKVNIFNEFGLSLRATQDVEQLIKLRERGQITHRRLLLEVRRRAVLSEDMDVEEEIEAVNAEPPVDGMSGDVSVDQTADEGRSAA